MSAVEVGALPEGQQEALEALHSIARASEGALTVDLDYTKLNSRWCPSGRRDGVKISGACGSVPGRGCWRSVAGVAGFARVPGLAGRLRVEDGRGRPLTPS